MPETTKPTTKSDDDHDAPTPAPAKLAARPAADPSRYAASSDPAVHKLLADRQGHVSTLEQLTAPVDPAAVKAAEAAIADIDRQLAEL